MNNYPMSGWIQMAWVDGPVLHSQVATADVIMVSFSKELYPIFTYQAGDIRLQKSVLMIHGENTTIIKYDILQSTHAFHLELLPLLAVRNIHQLKKANNEAHKEYTFNEGVLKTSLYSNTPGIFIQL